MVFFMPLLIVPLSPLVPLIYTSSCCSSAKIFLPPPHTSCIIYIHTIKSLKMYFSLMRETLVLGLTSTLYDQHQSQSCVFFIILHSLTASNLIKCHFLNLDQHLWPSRPGQQITNERFSPVMYTSPLPPPAFPLLKTALIVLS